MKNEGLKNFCNNIKPTMDKLHSGKNLNESERKQIIQLKEGDYVEVTFSENIRGKQYGTIILQEDGKNLKTNDGRYKIDFHNGFIGWHHRENIKFIER